MSDIIITKALLSDATTLTEIGWKTFYETSIRLGVWEKNPRAIRFYEKNGFIKFDEHIFQVGSESQTDPLMRKIL